ncbi:cysteine-rich receptor-like protein kinase, partial [Trifolium pratense]
AQLSDKWLWSHDPDQSYSVWGAYQLLNYQDSIILDPSYGLSWHKSILKVSIFAWRLLRDRLPTKVNLVTRGILPATTELADSYKVLFFLSTTPFYCGVMGEENSWMMPSEAQKSENLEFSNSFP